MSEAWEVSADAYGHVDVNGHQGWVSPVKSGGEVIAYGFAQTATGAVARAVAIAQLSTLKRERDELVEALRWLFYRAEVGPEHENRMIVIGQLLDRMEARNG